MHYIKFDTIESTNDFLKRYSKEQALPGFFYVYTDLQTKGRGQHANSWQSACCKNILLSIFIQPDLPVEKQYILNQIVSIAIVKVLQKFNIPDIKIKLPNDIMSGGKKIAGILIENVISQKKWKQSIIGIGLNVNQTQFDALPNATSMKLVTQQDFDVETVLGTLVKTIKELCENKPNNLTELFENQLLTKHNELPRSTLS